MLSHSLASFIYLETSKTKEMFIRKKKDELYLSLQLSFLAFFALFTGNCSKST